MSVTIRGNGSLNLHSSAWEAVQEIAREFGCALECKSRSVDEWRPGDHWVDVPEHIARALAKALMERFARSKLIV
jgi:hypothetical protein